ncbi:PQQ-binding-like beta-propeller repeat protein [Streptomyces sp. S.PB5]|uniref:outer membrane protein assembly factor BamB family protein n=1 Tax=Streptomyces sp. S.PB5 TaxID=3020844 RepID=UPI0025AF848B|nr:PQQ-binding-like beta-propeller repeat protein [Streptomyces sp. S.PB5]MDN3025254.1 PQQ-binding-like beta-propeller repeat protein [Streptomyces sp. S.PB5]
MSFGPPPSIYTQSALAADTARRRRRTKLLGAVAVIAAVALGGGGWLLASGGDSAPADAEQSLVQSPDDIRETTERAPVSPEGLLMIEHDEGNLAKTNDAKPRYAPGTWATDKVMVKGVADRLEGYDIALDADEKAWTRKLDGHICATSRHVTADGRTAVVVQPPQPAGSEKEGVCDRVVFFDLDTGKKLWQKKMPGAGSAFVTTTNLTLTKGVVAVAWGQGSVAYDMKSGKQLWNSTLGSKCEDKALAGGRALLSLLSCGSLPDVTFQVQELDPRTGKARWTYRVASGVQTVYLPSSDPPVLAVAAGDSEVTDLISLDGEGRHRTTIALNGYEAKCGERYFGLSFFGEYEACDGVVVGRTRAFVTSDENIAAGEPSDWIVAFDLATGRTTGKFDGRELQKVHPLRMSGDDLLIYRRGAGAVAPAAVVRWNPATDQETPLLLFTLPEDDDGELSDPEQSDILYEKGRVFFGKRELAADDKYPTDPVLMALAVGSAGLKH